MKEPMKLLGVYGADGRLIRVVKEDDKITLEPSETIQSLLNHDLIETYRYRADHIQHMIIEGLKGASASYFNSREQLLNFALEFGGLLVDFNKDFFLHGQISDSLMSRFKRIGDSSNNPRYFSGMHRFNANYLKSKHND